MPDGVLESVTRELDEIVAIVELDELAEWGEALLVWIRSDGGRVRETAESFVAEPTASSAVTAVTAAHAIAARLDSIATMASVVPAGGGGGGGVLSGWWNALKAKVQSLLSQVWSLISSKGNVADWTLAGEVGVSVLGLGKASIAIKFT